MNGALVGDLEQPGSLRLVQRSDQLDAFSTRSIIDFGFSQSTQSSA